MSVGASDGWVIGGGEAARCISYAACKFPAAFLIHLSYFFLLYFFHSRIYFEIVFTYCASAKVWIGDTYGAKFKLANRFGWYVWGEILGDLLIC